MAASSVMEGLNVVEQVDLCFGSAAGIRMNQAMVGASMTMSAIILCLIARHE